MKNAMLEKWKKAAMSLEPPIERVATPVHVLTGEAVDVARFCQHFWHPEHDAKGRVIQPGLASAERKGLFEKSIGTEVLELQEALSAANTAYMMTAEREASAPMERAMFVLNELKAVLAYMVDDDVDDIDDQRLAALNAAHEDALSQDALAVALDDYAGFADLHRDAVSGLGGFDEALIDEASNLSVKLRERSAQKLVGLPPGEQRAALDFRNRLAVLLNERMTKVRTVARFVFRDTPDIARKVTSAYERQRRAGRRVRETPESPDATPAEGVTT